MGARRTLLMTSCGGAAGLSALDLLAPLRSSVTIVAADSDPLCYARNIADVFTELPSTRRPADYRAGLLAAVERFRADAAIGCHSSELLLYAELGADLSARQVRWPVASAPAAQVAVDKLSLYRALRSAGIPVPDFAAIDEPFGGQKKVIKPRIGSGGTGCMTLDRGEPVPEHVLAEPHRYLQQTYADGEEISLDGVVLTDERIFGPVCRARRQTRYGLAFVSDAIDPGPEASRLYRMIARTVGTHGSLNVQAFLSPDGELRITDVNPRFPAGGLALSAALGLNIPLVVATDLLYGPSEVAEPVIEFRPLRQYKLFADRIVPMRRDDGS